jgi:ABC-2 type transport system ATP-binding protein
MATDLMIQAEGLTKRYGETQALAGVDIATCRPAPSSGCSGPNGAGKTTAVRVLTTLARPDSGSATVAGIDVLKHPNEVRRHIGVAAQDATLDPLLTGRQNLTLIGELSDMGRAESKARAKELLAQFELTDAADRVVKGYSGGMRRRLDLAGSLMTRPPVLFLDEPTTGLDPTSRQRVWEAIRGAARRGRHGAADDAIPRGGRRAGPRHRGRRPRPGHCARDAAGAEAGEPGRPPGSDVGRAARFGRGGHGAAGVGSGFT